MLLLEVSRKIQLLLIPGCEGLKDFNVSNIVVKTSYSWLKQDMEGMPEDVQFRVLVCLVQQRV